MPKLKNQKLTLKEKALLESIPTENSLESFLNIPYHFDTYKEAEEFMALKADEFLRKYFNMPLEIPIIISTRLNRNLGLFYSLYSKDSKTEFIPNNIKITSHYFDYEQDSLAQLLSTLYHECVHYALCAKKLRFKDTDTIFDSILEKLTITSLFETRYGGSLNKTFDLYSCSCGHFKDAYWAIKNPTPNIWKTCESCSEHPKYIRTELGKYAAIKAKFISETK